MFIHQGDQSESLERKCFMMLKPSNIETSFDTVISAVFPRSEDERGFGREPAQTTTTIPCHLIVTGEISLIDVKTSQLQLVILH